jgi:hypothetical protein
MSAGETIREAIRESTRLTRMRMGQAAFEWISFESIKGSDGTPIRFAQVPLKEFETQQGLVEAASLGVDDNFVGIALRNRRAETIDVWNSLRLPDDLTQKAFESPEELTEALEPSEVDYAFDSLTTLMEYSSPQIDGLSDEQIESLKKAFVAVDWSELSGRQWAAVKLCCRRLDLTSPLDNSSGSTSTDSSTPTSEDEQSTSSAAVS